MTNYWSFPGKGNTIGRMTTPSAEQVRQAIGDLLNTMYGDFTNAAKDLPYPYKTLWKNFCAPGPDDRTKTVTLDLVMGVYSELQKRSPKLPDFLLFMSLVGSGVKVNEIV